MFALTRKTDYAIIALAHMAANAGVLCSARDIAERFRLPSALVMNILKTLCQQNLVHSIRGARGGYALSRSPAELTLADIITAVEGPIRFFYCVGDHGENDALCNIESICPVKRPAHLIHERLRVFLQGITLESIVAESAYDTVSPMSLGILAQCQEPTKAGSGGGAHPN